VGSPSTAPFAVIADKWYGPPAGGCVSATVAVIPLSVITPNASANAETVVLVGALVICCVRGLDVAAA
jgi:hypothetical protein